MTDAETVLFAIVGGTLILKALNPAPPPPNNCPIGQHWDSALLKCVDDSTPPPNEVNLAQIPPASYFMPFRNSNILYPALKDNYTCIKVQPDMGYITSKDWVGTNELNGKWTAVKPGQRIHWSAYVFVEDSSMGDNYINEAGFFFGLDIYDGLGRIGELDGYNGLENGQIIWVPMGLNSWVFVEQDFIVQPTYVVQTAGSRYGQDVVPSGFIVITGIHSTNSHQLYEKASYYIRDTFLSVT